MANIRFEEISVPCGSKQVKTLIYPFTCCLFVSLLSEVKKLDRNPSIS